VCVLSCERQWVVHAHVTICRVVLRSDGELAIVGHISDGQGVAAHHQRAGGVVVCRLEHQVFHHLTTDVRTIPSLPLACLYDGRETVIANMHLLRGVLKRGDIRKDRCDRIPVLCRRGCELCRPHHGSHAAQQYAPRFISPFVVHFVTTGCCPSLRGLIAPLTLFIALCGCVNHVPQSASASCGRRSAPTFRSLEYGTPPSSTAVPEHSDHRNLFAKSLSIRRQRWRMATTTCALPQQSTAGS
jgi:hypothetical protein